MTPTTTTFTPRLEALDDRAVPALLGALGGVLNSALAEGPIVSTRPGPEVQNEVDFLGGAGTWGGQANPGAMTQQEQATQAEIDYLDAQNPR